MDFTETLEDEQTLYPEVEPFLDEGLITGVLHVVKSGKEATVLCCEAHPSTGAELLAAKIYRSRQNRSFKNDAVYQQGRLVLDSRLRRAYKNKSSTGRAVQSGEWIEHEWQTLNLLHDAGASVPRPYQRAGTAVLMEYLGERHEPALPLHKVRLTPQEARPLFHSLMRDVELMLACNRIHGDLSAYNILYHEGRAVLIDFPQAVDPRSNPNALSLLERDVENLCAYFQRQGLTPDAPRISRALWGRFVRGDL